MATEGLTYTTTAIKTTHDGQVIENLEIWVTSGDAITVTHDNVIIRNCIIHYVTGSGVLVDGANNVTVEDSLIVNASPPIGIAGESDAVGANIAVFESSGFKADHVTLHDGVIGIYLGDSPNATLTYIEGYNFHGPFPAGQFVQFNRSPNGSLTNFYTLNDPDNSRPEDNISVIDSQNVTISHGVIDGNNSVSGVGVMFEGNSQGGLVEYVDAIHMGNGAFSSYSDDVTFNYTRSFDNIDADQGRGESLSNGLIWNVSGNGVSITNSTYTNAANPGNIVWEDEDEGIKAVVLDVKSAPSATPTSHITNVFDWTDDGSTGDTTGPTVSVSMSDTSLTLGETATATFTFSEAPVGFTFSDLSATGGSLSAFTQVDATHYTATFTPTSGINIASAKVSVASSYNDAAGNAGTAGASANFTVNTIAPDTTGPSVSVSMSDTSLTLGETATATFTFSEAPVGFTMADLSATGGSLSGLAQVDATHYTAIFTPTGGINIANAKVSVASSYNDAAGNAGTAGASANFTVNTIAPDTTGPTVSVSMSDTSLTLGETATATFTFSEAPVGFTLADLSATGGSLSGLAQLDSTHYTATFTPSAGINIANAKVSVASSYNDAAGNAGTAGASANFNVDTKAPSVTVSISDTSLTLGETATATFTFSEAPVGFALADITVTGGTLSDLTRIDATHYAATFTPSVAVQTARVAASADTATTTAKISVSAGTYTDTAGNPGAAGASPNITVSPVVDTTAPTASVSISDMSLTVGETATATFTFSEAPVGFALTDTVANGGTLSNFAMVDTTHYTAKFTPSAGIQITDAKVSVTAASYTDAAGNAGTGATSSAFAVNTKAPVVDTTAPKASISISDSMVTKGETAVASFAFSEAPVGFALTDTVAKGGTLSNLTKIDATHYTAKFTPTADIQIADAKISLAAGSYTDAAGNAGAAAASSTFAVNSKAPAVDTIAPTVSIWISDKVLKMGEKAMAAFTFSEAPVGFTLGDVSAKGGTLSNLFKVDATHYIAKFTPTAGIEIADAKISLAKASYTDAAGNAGASGTSGNFVVDTNGWRGKFSWDSFKFDAALSQRIDKVDSPTDHQTNAIQSALNKLAPTVSAFTPESDLLHGVKAAEHSSDDDLLM